MPMSGISSVRQGSATGELPRAEKIVMAACRLAMIA
jgi:hypothetical protein